MQSASQRVAWRGITSLFRGMCMCPTAVTAINRVGDGPAGTPFRVAGLRRRNAVVDVPDATVLVRVTMFSPRVNITRSIVTSGSRAELSGLLRTLRRAKGREQVAGAVDQWVAAGVLGEPEAVASVLTVMGRNKHIEEAIELVHRLADPNVVTYNTLIKACNLARDPDLGKAIAVFDEMEAAGVRPTVVTYNTLIKACDTAGDRGKALEVRAEMKAAGLTPTPSRRRRRRRQQPDRGVRQRRGPRPGGTW